MIDYIHIKDFKFRTSSLFHTSLLLSHNISFITLLQSTGLPLFNFNSLHQLIVHCSCRPFARALAHR